MNFNITERRLDAQTQTNRAIPLTPGEIHFWLAPYDVPIGESVRSAYRRLLNREELAQEPRFYFAKDRQRYLVTRALVRTVLSRYISISPREWIFTTNAYGRPEIVNEQARNQDMVFNISHTDSLIVLAVTQQRALGVDVENLQAREAAIDIADHYFAAEEVAELNAAPRHEQQYRFFEYWTFKESYIKARGMGLSLPLDKFSFHYPGDHAVEIAIHPELADDSSRWHFWQFQPSPEYLVAVCAERLGMESPRFVVRKAVPLLSEKELIHEFLRVSDPSCTQQFMTTGDLR